MTADNSVSALGLPKCPGRYFGNPRALEASLRSAGERRRQRWQHRNWLCKDHMLANCRPMTLDTILSYSGTPGS